MKRSLLLAILAMLLVMTACKPNREKIITEIDSIRDSISMIDVVTVDDKADRLIELELMYAENFPEDSITPYYLFNIGEIYMNTGKNDEAIAIFDRMIEDYSDFDEIPMCYILKGQTLENAERLDDAKAVYEAYIELFPDHFLVNDMRINMEYFGLSPEEQLNEILKNKGADSLMANK